MKYVHPSQEHMDEALLRFGEPESQVGFRSVTGAKKGDLAGLGVMEREAAASLNLTEGKGQIQ